MATDDLQADVCILEMWRDGERETSQCVAWNRKFKENETEKKTTGSKILKNWEQGVSGIVGIGT